MELLIAAFITGVIGSLHCAGMCGPLAIAFNLKGGGNTFMRSLIYNLSRISAYAMLGIIFGLIGFGFFNAGWQQVLSIATGVIILVFILGKNIFSYGHGKSLGRKFIFQVQQAIQKQFSKHGYTSGFTLGFLNGLLPCGLVYIALAGATVSGNPLDGAIYMLLFGAGNFPLMFILASTPKLISVNKRLRIRKIIPVFSVIVAFLLIIRGMDLGIPYLSPHFDQVSHSVVCCDPPAEN